jgi:hypothetical protein
MAVLAAMTLIVGVYPDSFLVPITNYIKVMFSNTPQVLPLPTESGNAGMVQGAAASDLKDDAAFQSALLVINPYQSGFQRSHESYRLDIEGRGGAT